MRRNIFVRILAALGGIALWLLALCALGIAVAAPWFMVVGLLFTAGTLYISIAEVPIYEGQKAAD